MLCYISYLDSGTKVKLVFLPGQEYVFTYVHRTLSDGQNLKRWLQHFFPLAFHVFLSKTILLVQG